MVTQLALWLTTAKEWGGDVTASALEASENMTKIGNQFKSKV